MGLLYEVTFNFSLTSKDLGNGAPNLGLELGEPWLGRSNSQGNGKTSKDNEKLGHDAESLKLEFNC